MRSVSANRGPSYSRHSCSSQHNAKAIPMIIANSKTRESKQLDTSHQAEGHAKPGSFNQVQKGESYPDPSSSSVQIPSRLLQYLAVDNARVRSLVPFCSPAVAVVAAVSGAAAAAAAAVATMAVETLAVAPLAAVAAAASGAAVAAAAAVAAMAVATLAVAVTSLAAVAAAASNLAVVAAAAAAAAAAGPVAAVNPPWRTAVSSLVECHHLEDQGDDFPIPMRYR